MVACRGYVRYFGLSVNQPVHIQGCGDFNIDRIEVAEDPCSSGCRAAANGVQGMDMAGGGATVLAVADAAKRQGVVRLHSPDPLAGEQTWPTEEVRPFVILAIWSATAVALTKKGTVLIIDTPTPVLEPMRAVTCSE